MINTHIHYDHLLGNAAFRETGARFVGHAALPDAMAVSRDFFLERFAADLGPGAGPEAIVAPGILVEEHAQLDLGNRVLVAEGFPRTRELLVREGFEVQALDVSEFRKLDGGLSCLSLRF